MGDSVWEQSAAHLVMGAPIMVMIVMRLGAVYGIFIFLMPHIDIAVLRTSSATKSLWAPLARQRAWEEREISLTHVTDINKKKRYRLKK